MLTIDVDLQVEKQLLEMANRVPGAVENGLLRVGQHAQQVALREVGKIYARPIPRRKRSGRAMWNRSGNLLASVRAPLEVTNSSVALTAATPYANRRHGLGVDWAPRKPALGVIRRNPFFADTLEKIEPQVESLFADGVGEVLER